MELLISCMPMLSPAKARVRRCLVVACALSLTIRNALRRSMSGCLMSTKEMQHVIRRDSGRTIFLFQLEGWQVHNTIQIMQQQR
mmetsp:Transcript_26763/g.79484  ORF Transcript_26763/g.79484 Transcript_26763/m.79484 type:complete len:84 (-) Transcript_26763:165-416(-)